MKEEKTITINGEAYTLRTGMKAIIIFERLTDKQFELKNTTDVLAYVYAAMLAGTPGMKLGFDELLDAFDNAPGLLTEAINIVTGGTAIDKVMQMSNDGGDEPKKG
jgi:hypothetical protein